MAMRKLTLKELESEPYLMAIDGKVYDVKGFSKVHPGGDDLLYFASRDATYHYRSLHAAHGNTHCPFTIYVVSGLTPFCGILSKMFWM